MLNIPVSSETLGWEISKKLYELSRPHSVRDASDQTCYYCDVAQHPVTGFWYLRLPDIDSYPIHANADDSSLDGVLAPFEQQRLIDEQDMLAVREGISSNLGGYTQVDLFVPQYWKDLAVPDSEFAIEHDY
ncbi:hypothetical protein [Myxosarcina sp. GI1(2024)]